MNAGFISPSFRMLEMNWDQDFEMIKLGVPTLMANLYRAGHKELEHWDFDAQICEVLAREPSAFDIRRYFDAAAVLGLVAGTDSSLRPQTEKILDTLDVRERDIFGISLSAVLDRIANVVAMGGLAQCLAVVLKERYPKCAIVFGGLQVNPDSLQASYYRQFMEQCPQVDYSRVGAGDEVAVQLFRNIWSGEHERNRRLARILYRAAGPEGPSEVRLSTATGETVREALDPDLQADIAPMARHHHPAHTKAGATAQAEPSRAAAAILSERVALPQLAPVRYEDTHHADGTEISAQEGELDYSILPSRVPRFDPQLVDQFRYSGQQIMKRFRFDKELMLRFSRFENDQIVILPHIFVRGCNAPCGFCSYAYQPIEGEDIIRTVEGLKYLSETYNCRHFHFLNTQINSVYQYCDAFCDAIIAAKLNIFWSDCCNMRFLDEKLLEKMRRAGAMRLVYGVESPEDEMLKYIHKGITVAKIERMLKVAHELGIWNQVLLIAGMPHETKGKLDRMAEFFQRTAPYIDFYTVSSFYLIASSPWGRDPEKFGIERLSSPDQLLESQAFNEKADGRWESDNLRWEDKKQQIVDATRLFYTTIAAAKGNTRCTSGNIDLYLLMFLYSTLGHDRKKEMTEIYEATAPSVATTSQGPRPETFRINVPIVVPRMNEADQSSLVQMPVEIEVSQRAEGRRHFFATDRYTFSYSPPKPADGQAQDRAFEILRQTLPGEMERFGRLVKPFARAVESRFAPTTPERMSELLSVNLPKFRPFLHAGFSVVSRPGRTMMERMLDYNGLRS